MRDTAFCRQLLRAADTLTCPAALQQTYGCYAISVNPLVGSGDGGGMTAASRMAFFTPHGSR